MTTMMMPELLAKTPTQLHELLLQLRQEQMNLRFQKAAGQLANPNRWREVRTLVARLKTALTMHNKKGA
jgi:large subunit ribosomal protein L29